MKRLNYIYVLAPLCTVLSCAVTLGRLFGTVGGAIVCGIAAVVLWAVVWQRMYRSQWLRPEFAVLSALPVFFYIVLEVNAGETLDILQSPACQNLYFISWVASAFTIILTLKRCESDGGKRSLRQDPTLYVASCFTLLYALYTWVSTAGILFPPAL